MHHAKIERNQTIPKGRSIDFIDKYWLSAILKNFYAEFRMQSPLWGLYIDYWKFSGKKKKIDTTQYTYRLEIPSNEIPSNERSLIRARYRSLQRAADQALVSHYYGIRRSNLKQ